MSRLDELIAELCPDGVEYKEIQELFYLKNGYTPPKSNPSNYEYGTIPWFRMEDIRENGGILSDAMQKISQSAVKGSLFPANSIIVATSATIGVHALVTVDFLCNQRFTCLSLKDVYNEKICPKFIYYMCFKLDKWCLENSNFSSFASIDMSRFRGYKIPVPPLPVQEEIVRILDTFSELTAELTAELTTRRQQYQYYMNKLLSFDDSVPVVQLSDIFDFKNGLNKGKEFFGRGDYIVKYMDVYKHCALTEGDLSDRVEVTDSEKYKVSAKKGDVFFTRTSESREEIGFASVLLDEVEGCVFSGFLIRARQKTQKLLPKYCAYCFKAESVREQITRNCIFTTRASLSGANLGLVKLPVPPLEEQKRIVAILDRFDALCNDLTSGLPAEIEARKKQYEYYRDKLLTFKEAV